MSKQTECPTENQDSTRRNLEPFYPTSVYVDASGFIMPVKGPISRLGEIVNEDSDDLYSRQ